MVIEKFNNQKLEMLLNKLREKKSLPELADLWESQLLDFLSDTLIKQKPWSIDDFMYLSFALEFKKRLYGNRPKKPRKLDIIDKNEIDDAIKELLPLYQNINDLLCLFLDTEDKKLEPIHWVEMAGEADFPLPEPIIKKIKLSHFGLPWKAVDGVDPGELLTPDEAIALLKRREKIDISHHAFLARMIDAGVGIYIRQNEFDLTHQPSKTLSTEQFIQLQDTYKEEYTSYPYSCKNLVRLQGRSLFRDHSFRNQDAQEILERGAIKLGNRNRMFFFQASFSDYVLGRSGIYLMEPHKEIVIESKHLVFRREEVLANTSLKSKSALIDELIKTYKSFPEKRSAKNAEKFWKFLRDNHYGPSNFIREMSTWIGDDSKLTYFDGIKEHTITGSTFKKYMCDVRKG